MDGVETVRLGPTQQVEPHYHGYWADDRGDILDGAVHVDWVPVVDEDGTEWWGFALECHSERCSTDG